MSRKIKLNNEIGSQLNWETILFYLGIVILLSICLRVYFSGFKNFYYPIFPICLGILLQSFKYNISIKENIENFKACMVVATYITAPFLVLILFSLFKIELTDFLGIIDLYAAFFPIILFAFYVIILVDHAGKEFAVKFSEGLTFLKSLSLIYYAIEMDLFSYSGFFANVFIALGIFLILLSIVSAFTYIKITNNLKVILSVWSTLILLLFTFNHISSLFSSFNSLQLNPMLVLDFFILGSSAVFIAQNIDALLYYYPENTEFFSKYHFKQIEKANRKQMERYKDEQVRIIDSFICLIIASTFYSLNYILKIFSAQSAIWISLLFIPNVIDFKNRISQLLNTSSKD